MAFPEAERDDAPKPSRISENESNAFKPEQFSLANDFNSPQLKNLFDRADSFSANKEKTNAELPRFTLGGTSPDKANGDHPKAEEPKKGNTDLSSCLPSLSFDTDNIKNKTNELVHDAFNWLEHMAATQNAAPQDKNSEVPEAKAAPPEEKPAAPVETVDGNWKKEGDNWTLYDKQGQKLDRYNGKVSDVSRDDEGNTIVKLNDGRTMQEKKDGSKLEFDSSKHLTQITYKDGSTRNFKWDGDELSQMSSKAGEWKRQRESSKTNGSRKD